MKLKECDICGRLFPEELLHTLANVDKVFSSVCPLCARIIIRKQHNLPNFEFRTPANRARYAAALKYIKDSMVPQ